MKHILLFIALAFLITSCQVEKTSDADTNSPFTVLKEEAITFKNLTIYPIAADPSFIENNEGVKELMGLKEAIQLDRFRISEKKPFGRFEDMDAVNNLTVQNKTDQTIFLMNGDIVQGGRQDRVLAQSRIIPPRTITDIAVFCVERGRWQFRDSSPEEEGSEQEKTNQRALAFKGYYNVASSQIRRTIEYSNEQKEVWEQVSKITTANQAENPTHAYTGLEASEEYTKDRAAYLNALELNFDENKRVVGWIAGSGSEILGADIFGHPELCERQYEALLHSYITDVIPTESKGNCCEERIDAFAAQLWKDFQKGGNGVQKLTHQNALVYFSKL